MKIQSKQTQFIKVKSLKIQNNNQKWRPKRARVDRLKAFTSNYKNFAAFTLILHKRNNNFEQYEYNLTYTDKILDFLYQERLDLFKRLNEDNYLRVFVGPIQTQVHLLIKGSISQDLLMLSTRLLKIINLMIQNTIVCSLHIQPFMKIEAYGPYLILINPQTHPNLLLQKTTLKIHLLIQNSESLTIQKFIDDFGNKNLKEFYKSEPIPEYTENKDIYNIFGQTIFIRSSQQKKEFFQLLFWDSKNQELF
ncbi:unnamed protein product (macronuclear) [Paramecium tetraurelia]|uniref:Uncharacterized protein n=1 Tax=Paramecium tetraurelia TaxID=5888 RepID=A0DNL5_PARTE|nr:uncharacterized protein GSPATT00018828001 [Paramecium tetraurelia]CAK84632.1 unnamed protein product [Paramecium tetraurelia]|eukprot:XP_001452029.1 hypothetical protein (macronuclear) [Paramecium tetraurelia strain d4-2]